MPGDPAKKVIVTQESGPVGSAGGGSGGKSVKGFHIFTVSIHVEPTEGEYKPGQVHYAFTVPTGWKWVEWGNHYYYNDETYQTTPAKPLDVQVDGKVLSFDLDTHLNSTTSDGTRLAFTVMVEPVSGTKPGTYSDGLAVVGKSGQQLLPVQATLWGITTQ